MMILTVQDYSVIEGIIDNTYMPNFMKSSYACLSIRFTKAYLKILTELSKKTGRSYQYGVDTCMWGWANSPYLPLHKRNGFLKGIKKRKYAVFVEVPDEELVLSEYSCFCGYVQGDFQSDDFLVKDEISWIMDYIQCSFWNINPRNIKLIVDLDKIESGYSVEDLYELNKLNDVSYLFDKRAYELLYA